MERDDSHRAAQENSRVKPTDYHRLKALVVEYKQASAMRRREIAAELTRLTTPILRAWKVWDRDDRQDIEQDAYLVMLRALETYDLAKGRGAEFFLLRLKGYYQHLHRDRIQASRRRQLSDEIVSATGEEPIGYDPEQADHVFWARLRGKLTEDEWSLVEARFIQGLDTAEMSHRLHVSQRTVQLSLKSISEKIRLFMALTGPSLIPGEYRFGDGEPLWLTKDQFLTRVPITREYLKKLLTPAISKAHCPYFIEPCDTLPFQGGLIRYLESQERGLVFPRIRTKKGKALAEAAVAAAEAYA